MPDQSLPLFTGPNGQPFRTTQAWWNYVLTQSEAQRLDYLIGAALLDSRICQQVMAMDENLLQAFQFSEDTIAWLTALNPETLEALAEAVSQRLDGWG